MRIYPKTISLKTHNRYNEDVRLEQIEGNKYKFICDDDYIGATFAEDNKTITAIDPSGGPFLSIGYIVTDKFAVERIYHSITHQCFVVILKQK